MNPKPLAAGTLAVTLLAGVAASLAQTAPSPSAPGQTPARPAPAAHFSDEKLASFAVAFLEVDRINREYAPRLQQASTPDEQKKVREEASNKMIEAVEVTDGISTAEYSAILTAAQADPDLAKQLNQAIGEAAAK